MEEDFIKSLKKEFFARRNGILADAMRRNGDPHAFVMGCMLSDIIEVAARYTPDARSARALWNDRDHRECRLAAPMLFPRGEMSDEEAHRWALDVLTEEEADVLCHRLLRHLPGAWVLAAHLVDGENPLTIYTGWRLVANLQAVSRAVLPPAIQAKAQAALAQPALPSSLSHLLRQLLTN